MQIILSPQAAQKTTEISVNGLVVTVDGIDYDLSLIPEGGQAEAAEESPFVGTMTREKVTVQYQYDSSLAEPDQSTDLADYTFDNITGEIPSPIKWKDV